MEKVYDKSNITLYLGDSRLIVPTIDPKSIYLLLTDPPYGISLDTRNKTRNRDRQDGTVPVGLERFSSQMAKVHDYPPIFGDNTPFDPGYLLGFKRIVLFGANNYADKLPNSSAWLIWDKLNGLHSKREIGFNNASDFEMIWTNIGKSARIIPHRWTGLLKDSEHRDKRVHPTQKPILLMQKLIEYYTPKGAMVLDPYAGSGSTLIAAQREERSAIGIEIMPDNIQSAIIRLEKG